jgi:DNA-directed RNA polymerase subunit RPC12/RpoP
MLSFLAALIGCRHEHRTWPRRDELGTYVRCTDCGARLPYTVRGEWRQVREDRPAGGVGERVEVEA